MNFDADGWLRTLGTRVDGDEVTDRILDAAAELFLQHGIGRCSVEDVAERSGLGRTTVYRRFGSRQSLVDAVIARECRRFFGGIIAATSHLDRFEDLVVDGLLVGLSSADSSVLAGLARSEPDLLHVLTVGAAPVIDAATDVLADAYGPTEDPDHVRVVAEALMRLAVSLLLTPSSAIELSDPDRARRQLHQLLDPVLGPLGARRAVGVAGSPG